MPVPFEQQPFYPLWRKAIESFIAARAARETANPDMRETADAAYRLALETYRSVVRQIR
jgi:hypothetical protein